MPEDFWEHGAVLTILSSRAASTATYREREGRIDADALLLAGEIELARVPIERWQIRRALSILLPLTYVALAIAATALLML